MTLTTIMQRNMPENNRNQLSLLPEVGSAILSDCGAYRYVLRRIWDENRPPLVYVMLNPSTADGFDNDPTMRRCIGFAQRENAGGMVVVNLFAFRSPYPEDLKTTSDPVGAENDQHLLDVFTQAKAQGSTVICAWGQPGKYLKRKQEVVGLLRQANLQACQLGEGVQKHPLYLAAETPLLPLNVNLLTPR